MQLDAGDGDVPALADVEHLPPATFQIGGKHPLLAGIEFRFENQPQGGSDQDGPGHGVALVRRVPGDGGDQVAPDLGAHFGFGRPPGEVDEVRQRVLGCGLQAHGQVVAGGVEEGAVDLALGPDGLAEVDGLGGGVGRRLVDSLDGFVGQHHDDSVVGRLQMDDGVRRQMLNLSTPENGLFRGQSLVQKPCRRTTGALACS